VSIVLDPVWRWARISRCWCAVTPATVNRELAYLKRMLNMTRNVRILLKGWVSGTHPMARVSLERQRNARGRVPSGDEFRRLHNAAEAWLQPILLVA
jgi:hypothetical protein